MTRSVELPVVREVRRPAPPDPATPNPVIPIPVAPNFDRLALPYRWLELLTFGPLLQRMRLHFLEQLGNCRRALVLGDGDGRFTAALLDRWPQLHVHAIDASPTMLRILSQNSRAHRARLTTEVSDLRCWAPQAEGRYDLIVTHFFLDCLSTDEVASLARRVGPAAEADALWVVSDFAVPETRFGRWLAGPLVRGLYLAFHILTGLVIRRLPDHAAELRSTGWQLQSTASNLKGLLISQIWRSSNTPRLHDCATIPSWTQQKPRHG